jgi:hypothetical protein
MELCFDDGMIEQDDHNGYENYTHECDFETSIENYGQHERYQQQRQPSSQWTTPRSYGYRHMESLTDDQTAWDSVSEEGKGKILDYNVKRATNNSNSNSSFATTTSGMPNNMSGCRITLTEDSSQSPRRSSLTRCCPYVQQRLRSTEPCHLQLRQVQPSPV